MKRKYILPLLLLLQIIVLRVISFFPLWVESFYSNGWYPSISSGLRKTLGSVPFSVGDCIYSVLIIMAITWFWRKRKNWKSDWKNLSLEILSAFSVFYFFFNLLWALNYYRQPLSEKMEIKTDYTTAELIGFTQKLIVKTNALQLQITKNANDPVKSPYSKGDIFGMTQNGYNHLGNEYSFFKFKTPSLKNSLFSLPLTYMGFGGYLNPFFNEAQVNDKLLMYSFPTVACHEMAHQIGYASESEANFIGFLACKKNPDLYFQYAAYTLALQYCLRNIDLQDEAMLKPIIKTINPGIMTNFRENKAFWKSYETPIETVFDIFYDNFLKLNQQKDGMESYSRFVDLMVNYYQHRSL